MLCRYGQRFGFRGGTRGPCRPFFFGGSGQSGGLGGPFGTHLCRRAFGTAAFGIRSLGCQPSQLGFLLGADRGSVRQLGGTTLVARGLRQRRLLRLDAHEQRRFGQALGLHLLGCGRIGLGSGPRHPGGQGLLLRVQPGRGSVSGFRLVLGAAARFLRCLLLLCRSGSCCDFRRLVGTQMCCSLIGGTTFCRRALNGYPCKFFFRFGTRRGGGGQLGGGMFAGLRGGECVPFGLDALLQCGLGATFGLRLLGCRDLCRRVGGGATTRLLCRTLFLLLSLLCGGNVLDSLQLTRLRGDTGTFRPAAACQRSRHRRLFGLGRICLRACALRSELPALALGFHQSSQQLAQELAPGSGFRTEFDAPG